MTLLCYQWESKHDLCLHWCFFSISLEDSIVCQIFSCMCTRTSQLWTSFFAERKSTCGSWNSAFCAVSFPCCSDLYRPISEIQHPECGMLLHLDDFLWFEQNILNFSGGNFIYALSLSIAEKYFEVSAGLVATYFPRTVNWKPRGWAHVLSDI